MVAILKVMVIGVNGWILTHAQKIVEVERGQDIDNVTTHHHLMVVRTALDPAKRLWTATLTLVQVINNFYIVRNIFEE